MQYEYDRIYDSVNGRDYHLTENENDEQGN